jgi:hypothetical protein
MMGPYAGQTPKLPGSRAACLGAPLGVHSALYNHAARNMAIPDYQALMLPGLEHAAPGETSVRDCIRALADKLGLSQDERSELLPSGKQAVFANRVHWARTYLVQAGLLEATRRAYFRDNPEGLRSAG